MELDSTDQTSLRTPTSSNSDLWHKLFLQYFSLLNFPIPTQRSYKTSNISIKRVSLMPWRTNHIWLDGQVLMHAEMIRELDRWSMTSVNEYRFYSITSPQRICTLYHVPIFYLWNEHRPHDSFLYSIIYIFFWDSQTYEMQWNCFPLRWLCIFPSYLSSVASNERCLSSIDTDA